MYQVKYSSINYYPDVFLLSNIVVGVFFEITSNDYYKKTVKFISQKEKLYTFDDELDKEFTEYFLDGLEDQFVNSNVSLEEYKKVYANNFKFSKTVNTNFESLKEVESFVDDTKKYILHIGLPKESRLNDKDRKRYISNYIINKYENPNIKKSKTIKGFIDKDNATFDFYINNNDEHIAYKIINKSNQALFTAKSYISFSILNDINIIFILEDEMQEEKDSLLKMAKHLNASVDVLLERELVS
ncbi:hypothetical protein [Macrococcus sp. S115]|uniref:hypothetical protein n=1 Tax=Macrococcus sp. S115 TaxID=3047480 RepID=UPI0024BD39F2|nr:hypothetical protein [Macrococcus sp. S115]MDJ1110608.1 hypothetical protein [Macrococcus sp. S115]